MCTTLRHQQVTTRKRHRCHGCERIIPAKVLAISWAGVDNGDFGSGYSCLDCEEYLQENREDFDDCIYEGDLSDCDFARHPILEPVTRIRAGVSG